MSEFSERLDAIQARDFWGGEFLPHAARVDVLWMLGELRKAHEQIDRVRELLDSLGDLADNHSTHSEDCHTWHPECLVIKVRRALDGEVSS